MIGMHLMLVMRMEMRLVACVSHFNPRKEREREREREKEKSLIYAHSIAVNSALHWLALWFILCAHPHTNCKEKACRLALVIFFCLLLKQFVAWTSVKRSKFICDSISQAFASCN